MATTNSHAVKAFDGDLEEIRAWWRRLGGMAEFAVARSIHALIADDQAMAAQIVAGGAAIDRLSKGSSLIVLKEPQTRCVYEKLRILTFEIPFFVLKSARM